MTIVRDLATRAADLQAKVNQAKTTQTEQSTNPLE